MAIKIISKGKYEGEGRAFGDSNTPLKKLVVLLSTDGSTPSTYADVDNLEECDFAPGSLLLDTANNTNYIFDGTTWKEWG